MTSWPDELAGVWVPIPVAADVALAAPLDRLSSAGVAGVAACASGGEAGEYSDLDEAEWDRLVLALLEAAADADLPVVVGVGHAEPTASVARAQRVAAAEPEVLLAPLPDRLGTDQLPAWAAELSAAAPDTPLVLGEPPRAPVLTASLVDALRAQAPTVAGLALSPRDEDGYEQLRRFEEELAMWVPSGELATGFRHGAVGSIAELACLSPAECVRWSALLEEDVQAALAYELLWNRFVEDRLRPLRARYGVTQAGLDKALAVAGGWWPGTTDMRWPNEAVPSDVAGRIPGLAREAGVLL